MNSLGRLTRIPGILSFTLESNTARYFRSDQSSRKDGNTTKGNDGRDKVTDEPVNKTNIPPTDPNVSTTTATPNTSIENFQIYKTVPPDVDELFLKRNERFRYRRLNEMLKKEMDQLILQEKGAKDNSNKVTPVAFKRSIYFDEKLDNLVKNLLSETKSVMLKLTGDSAPTKQTSSKALDQAKDVKDPCACPTEVSGTSGGGGNSGKDPPPSVSGDVIVSPYVDNKGNIDYTKAVVKSKGGDTAAEDILRRLIQDPVKPLPTFVLPNIPRQSETILLRSGSSIDDRKGNSAAPQEVLRSKSAEDQKEAKAVVENPETKPESNVKEVLQVVNKCKSPETKPESKCSDSMKLLPSAANKSKTPKIKQKSKCANSSVTSKCKSTETKPPQQKTSKCDESSRETQAPDNKRKFKSPVKKIVSKKRKCDFSEIVGKGPEVKSADQYKPSSSCSDKPPPPTPGKRPATPKQPPPSKKEPGKWPDSSEKDKKPKDDGGQCG